MPTINSIKQIDPALVKAKLSQYIEIALRASINAQMCANEALSASQRAEKAKEKLDKAQGKSQGLRMLAKALEILEYAKYAQVRLARKRILWLKNEVTKDTITVARKNNLENELLELRKSIKTICPDHPIVIQERGHDTFDDGYSCGNRTCVVCGLEQRSDLVNSRETYEDTELDDKRIVTRVPYVPHPKIYSIWKPLEEVLTDCMSREALEEFE